MSRHQFLRAPKGAMPAIAGAVALVFASAHGADAEETWKPNPANGQAIAERLCAGCHIVSDAQSSGGVVAGIPSFKAIANKEGQTGSAIVNMIMNPHGEMVDTRLTRNEIGDVLSYLESLRDPAGGGEPLLPKQGPEKVPYPKPA